MKGKEEAFRKEGKNMNYIRMPDNLVQQRLDQELADVLTAIRLGGTVDQIGEERFPNGERHLKSIQEIRTRFAAAPDAVERTLEVAACCT